jgi:hypothetical protein
MNLETRHLAIILSKGAEKAEDQGDTGLATVLDRMAATAWRLSHDRHYMYDAIAGLREKYGHE